ncbi:Type II secretion system protein J (fragment) [Pseudomonas sp. JV551A1]
MRSLWERACPRCRRRGGWHRLRRCSRVNPLPQVWRIPSAGGVPVGAGLPAKQATRWMAPAAPVFAGEPAPQVWRIPSAGEVPVGAGMPAKQATRWMAPAAPVFAGEPAPPGMAHSFSW